MKIDDFKRIIPESDILDGEMDALRGGNQLMSVKCDIGELAKCGIGVSDDKLQTGTIDPSTSSGT